MKTVTRRIRNFLAHPKLPSVFLRIYDAKTNFWNYGMIAGIGVLINQIALHFFIQYFQLWQADLLAIAIAWMWNYQNALGILSKYWGMK